MAEMSNQTALVMLFGARSSNPRQKFDKAYETQLNCKKAIVQMKVDLKAAEDNVKYLKGELDRFQQAEYEARQKCHAMLEQMPYQDLLEIAEMFLQREETVEESGGE
jgi:hypothetical protein